MRELINLIVENEILDEMSVDQIGQLKAILASKIQELPADDFTVKALREIEDLLSSVNAGGRLGLINNKLNQIEDVAVQKAQKLLAKYILSLDMTTEEREELFALWKSDKLVNHNLLLSPGKHSITEIINGYSTNAGIRELTNDLSQIAALGQGKGEFLLNVFSKSITKLQKGDLKIGGKTVELKTLDVGGGRFYDQEVKPSSGFSSAVENFTLTWADYIQAAIAKPAASGLKLSDVIEIRSIVDTKQQKKFDKSFEQVLNTIFPGMDVNPIMAAVQTGQIGPAKAAYAEINLNYYIGIKKDDGILYIDLTSDPASLVYFSSNQELQAGGLRLHAETVYPITTDPRYAYPQMRIVGTKGAAATAAEPIATGTASTPTPRPKAAGKTLGVDDIGAPRQKRDTNTAPGRARR